MKKIKSFIFSICAIFMLMSVNLFAENSYILWKVTKGESVVYLAPTIHLLPDSFYPLNEKVLEIFDKSDSLVVELDITSPEFLSFAGEKGMSYMILEKDKTLDQLISAEDYKELKTKFLNIGLDLDVLKKFKPSFINVFLVQYALMMGNYKEQSGLDIYFINRAKEKSKNIIELETPELQFEKFFNYDLDLQIIALKEGMENNVLEEIKTMVDSFVNNIKQGNLEAFEKEFVESKGKDERLVKYNKEIFDERNIGMANKIEGYLQNKGTYFVAVGAGHYVGENNIRELLLKKGYKIERVKL